MHSKRLNSKIDKIRVIRGELPLEVEDLEDEIEGLRTRVGRLNDELGEIDKAISDKKTLLRKVKDSLKVRRATKQC